MRKNDMTFFCLRQIKMAWTCHFEFNNLETNKYYPRKETYLLFI